MKRLYPAFTEEIRTILSLLVCVILSSILLPYIIWTVVLEWNMYNHLYIIPVHLLSLVSIVVLFAGSDFERRRWRNLGIILLTVGVIIAIFGRNSVFFIPSLVVFMAIGYAFHIFIGGTLRRRISSPFTQWVTILLIVFCLVPVMNRMFYRGIFNHIDPVDPAKSLLYKINEFGFRGPALQKERPDTTSLRILFLGNSSTFGFPYQYEDTFSFLVADSFECEAISSVEILNAAVPGFSLGRILHSLPEYLEFYPDVVFIMIGLHSHRAKADFEFEYDYVKLSRHSRRYWLRPPIFKEIRSMMRKHERIPDEPFYYTRLLDELISILEAHDTDPVFLEYASADIDEQIRLTIEDISRNAEIDMIPLREALRTAGGTHFDKIHPNRKGHRIIAAQIREYLYDRYCPEEMESVAVGQDP